MLKRLIEVALPLKEVSELSGKEKRQISALHIWWARRPLSTCRAVVFASMIPDPDDPECPATFRTLVRRLLDRNEFSPKNNEGGSVEDTPRNRCLEFIKYLVRWENSNKEKYIGPAQQLIAAAHEILHTNTDGAQPIVIDPFAGGGAIPLEALRLGCRAYAFDLNPVAHIIQLCTLVYPQKYTSTHTTGDPVPDYIRKAVTEETGFLFGTPLDAVEAEYRQNPLASEVRYWGNWIVEQTRSAIDDLYPQVDSESIPVAFLWARTVKCKNPSCGSVFPLHRQVWLCKEPRRQLALKPIDNQKNRSRNRH